MRSPEPAPIRLLIADDHAMFRQGLRALLEEQADLHIVGEARDGNEAIAMTRELRPDVLLLDVAMPGLSGLEVVRLLHEAGMSTRVILLSAAVHRAELPRALTLGVRGVVVKDAAVESLLKAIRVVHSGEYWVNRTVISDLVRALERHATEPSRQKKNPFGLTKRELDIVRLVAAGCSNKDISREFSLREDTVKHHLSSIFDKTGMSTRLELALFALHNNLAGN